jgi:transcription initiation factor TFIIF subunit beta
MIESKDDDEQPKKKQALRNLNLDALDQSVWLVKLPNFVAEKWSKAENNDILGSFRVGMVSNERNKPPSKQLVVTLNDEETMMEEDSVKTFILSEVNNTLGNGEEMVAFSHNDKMETFQIEGRVTKSLVLRPQQSSEYRNLVRERGLKKLANRHETRIVDPKELQKAQQQSYTIESLTSVKQEMKRKANKPTGDYDPKLLLRKMLEAFEQCERQSFETLLGYCSENVPGFSKEQDLRDLLDEYARYNKKGPYQRLWELKSEYKDHVDKEA